MAKKILFITLFITCLLFACSYAETTKQADEELVYYTINNEELKQQILNYFDSVNISSDEKILCVYFRKLNYEIDSNNSKINKVMQYNIYYETCAFNIVWDPIIYVRLDTLTVAIRCDDAQEDIFMSNNMGWKYLKNIFKSDYQYYLNSSDSIYPIPIDGMDKTPMWTLIFEDGKLIQKIVL